MICYSEDNHGRTGGTCLGGKNLLLLMAASVDIPGSSKKTAMARDKLLTFVAPSNPHFKVATEKG